MISGCLVRSAHIQSGAGDATNGVVSLSPRSTLVHLRPFCTVPPALIEHLEAKHVPSARCGALLFHSCRSAGSAGSLICPILPDDLVDSGPVQGYALIAVHVELRSGGGAGRSGRRAS